jgi:hypothetical protein
LRWFRSYLSDRMQLVLVSHTCCFKCPCNSTVVSFNFAGQNFRGKTENK